jgi:prepilin-type N-terminal cleavage/methylation domain-containing protein
MVSQSLKGSRDARHAFTLMELLLVIALIALLAGISLAVYMATTSSTQIGVTNSMLKKVKIALDKQWTAVRESAQKDAQMLPWPGLIPKGAADLNRENWVMLRLQQAFPRTFNEVLNPDTTRMLPTLPAYHSYFVDNGMTFSIKPDVNLIAPGRTTGLTGAQQTAAETQMAHAYEASACLLMALQRGPSGTGFTPEQLGNASVKKVPVQLTNGTSVNVPVLVDAWGQPIWLAFQQGTASGQAQLTTMLLSSGPNNLFESTVTFGVPLTFNGATGVLNPNTQTVAVVNPSNVAPNKPQAYDLFVSTP